MKRYLLPLAMLLVIAMLLLPVGCSAGDGGEGEAGVEDEASLRIVSVMPSNTELLFALGLGDAVVGVTDFCDYPPGLEEAVEAGRIKRLGDSFNLNEELLVSLEPDLVLFGFASDAEERLAELDIRSEVIAPASLEETYASIRRIGELTGIESAAEKLAGDMETAIEKLKAETAQIEEKPLVLMLLDLDYLYVAGSGTLEDELIAVAGGINAAGAAGYAQLSEEALIEADPDIIICTFPLRERILAEKDAWKDLAAVKNEAIYDIDGDLVNRPTPRLVQGLELLIGIFHP